MKFISRRQGREQREPRVLIVIENMSYTYDTRVRNIARSLERNGCRIWVICPRRRGDPFRRVEGRVTIHFFPLPPLPGGLLGHLIEYTCSFFFVAVGSLILLFTARFDVIHICNPPDLFFPIGRFYRLLGRKFVFDVHDLCPELWQIRYGGSKMAHSVLLALERATVAAANHVLVTSETARQRISSRDAIRQEAITLVRNGPDMANFPPPSPASASEEGIEVGYIGDMNPQDGIDNLLNAASYIRNTLGRKDIRFVLIGDGSSFEDLKRTVERLGLTDGVTFTGRLAPHEAMKRLSACTFCVQPDLSNPFNDSCVMVKSLEYMALGKAIAAFDLTETRRVCGDAALYATDNDYHNLAALIVKLADDPPLRERLGATGRARVEQGLSWSFSEQQLLQAYRNLWDVTVKPLPTTRMKAGK